MMILDILTRVVLAIYLLAFLCLGRFIVQDLRNRTWRDVGRAYGMLAFAVRHRDCRTILIALTVAAVTQAFIPAIESESSTTTSHNWPEMTAIEKLTVYLPTTYPFVRERSTWPPFTGIRVELGGDQ